MKIDLGESTGGMTDLDDAALGDVSRGADTTSLDAATDRAYGDYLNQWGDAIRQRFSGRKSND